MASITFSGQLDQAMNEAAAEGNKILFIPQQTVGEVLPGAASELVVESDGLYSITLSYNTYSIYHYSDVTKRRTLLATDIVVSADTVVSTIPDLIGSTVPVTEDSVLTIQGYLTDAQDSASAAAISETNAAASEAAVTNRVAAYEVETTEYLINSFDGSALAVGDVVRTLGYYNAGDGGGAEWVKTGDTGTANQSVFDTSEVSIYDSNGNNYTISREDSLPSIIQLGAIDGGDATSQIDALFAFKEDNPSSDGVTLGGARGILLLTDAYSINIPKGEFTYSGAGYTPINEKVIVIRGDSPSSSTIRIESDCHLVNPTSDSKVMAYVEFSNIKIIGGRGAFYNTKTDIGTVAHGKRVYNCIFAGYTSVAFGSLQDGDARWAVRNTFFEGGDSGTPVGLLLPNEIAETDINGCNTFTGNVYDMILTSTGISEFTIGPTNAFFNLPSRSKSADVWIMPGETSNNKNGYGVRFIGNRHSNENMDSSRPNILFADRDETTDSHVFQHSTSVSSGKITGISFVENNYSSTGNPSSSDAVGFIYSYTPNVSGLRFVGNTISQWRPSIIEFDSSITSSDLDSGLASTNFALINNSSVIDKYPTTSFSNHDGFGIVQTESGQSGLSCGIMSKIGDSVTGFNNLTLSSDPTSYTKGSDVSSVQISDNNGTTRAGTFTFGSDQIVVIAQLYTVDGNLPIWYEFDCKKSTSTTLEHFLVEVNIGTNTYSKVIKPSDTWSRVRIPVPICDSSYTSSTLSVYIAPRLFLDAGTSDSIDIGRVSIYQADGPIDSSLTVI